MSSMPMPTPPASTTDAATQKAIEDGSKLWDEYTQNYGIYHASELGHYVRSRPHDTALVQGMMPSCSVNILVGDSGIGKSALAYQLALCCAAGVPFLGMATRPSKVVYVDYENSPADSHWILEQQRKHLGLKQYPSRGLLVWPVQASPNHHAIHTDVVEKVIRQFAADLVIIDSLRSYSATMEQSLSAAARIQQLRIMTNRHGTAALLVHHLRKQGVRSSLPPLTRSTALDWLARGAGCRALINHSDVRLAVEVGEEGRADLVLRGHHRVHGEIGPLRLQRVWDDAGDPLGYERVQGNAELLENPEQEAAFARLPAEFHFTGAMAAYGRQQRGTNLFLQKLLRLGLAVKVERGLYRKSAIVENTEQTGVKAA